MPPLPRCRREKTMKQAWPAGSDGAYDARNAVRTERNFTGSALTQLLRIIAAGVLCGVGFGLVMSIVSNGFVIGVKWLTEQREGMSFGMMSVGGLELSAAPLLSLFSPPA